MGLDRRSNQGAVIETNIELQSSVPTPTQFLRCRASEALRKTLGNWIVQNSCETLALESSASRRTRPTKIFQLRLFHSKTYTSLIRNSSSIQTFSLILERCRFDKVISEFRFCTFYMRSPLKSDFESYDS
jgi:hypothetical protein